MSNAFVLNRSQAELLEPGVLGNAIISITEPGDFAELKPGWDKILRLGFHDVEHENYYVTVEDLEDGEIVKKSRLCKPMNTEQAAQVVSFLDKLDPDEDFVVHCWAGISRSMATASFAADFLGYGLRIKSGINSNLSANQLVYRLLINEYLKENSNCKNPESGELLNSSDADLLLPLGRWKDGELYNPEAGVGSYGAYSFESNLRTPSSYTESVSKPG